MDTDTEFGAATRRSLLAFGAASATVAAVGGVKAASAPLDLATPEGKLRAYMLMRGALDDRLVIGFVSGRYFGVIGEEITPLYGVVAATFARYRARADGGYSGASYEVPFFTDLATGAALDHWTNPYTGEEVTVPAMGFPPAAIVITPDLRIKATALMPGFVADDRVISTAASGDDVWFTEETTSAFKDTASGKSVHYNELVTVHASAADLTAPDAKRVRCQTAYTSVVSWRPWLKMGDRPGHLLGNAAGRYGMPMEDLTASWRAAAASHRPEVLRDPSGPLNAIFASFAPR